MAKLKKIKKTYETMTTKEKLDAGLCKKMEGKMNGMWSISTSCRSNPLCIKNHKIHDSICEKCYAHILTELRKALHTKGERNAKILTKEVLADSDLPEFDNIKYFRFEAFGDLHNIIQIENYVNMAKHNPDVRCTLYTKNYPVALEFFKTHKCPSNFILMVSSLFINKPVDISKFLATGNFEPSQLKVFTVYSCEYLKEHPEIKINCGSRCCVKCHKCYENNDIVYINEILKSDQKRAEEMIKMRDPVTRKAEVDKVFSKFW